ncbi:MAG: hypothetical protein ACI8VT_000933 [Saprospiraceae bacterium]|jgi:hypothetical protein
MGSPYYKIFADVLAENIDQVVHRIFNPELFRQRIPAPCFGGTGITGNDDTAVAAVEVGTRKINKPRGSITTSHAKRSPFYNTSHHFTTFAIKIKKYGFNR